LQPHLGELADDVLPDLPGTPEILHTGQEPQYLQAAGAAAGAEFEATVGEVIEHGHTFGHLGRVVDLR
jgi:hypothetical protein